MLCMVAMVHTLLCSPVVLQSILFFATYKNLCPPPALVVPMFKHHGSISSLRSSLEADVLVHRAISFLS